MKLKTIAFLFSIFIGIQLNAQQKYSKVRVFANKQETTKIKQLGIDLENISGKPGIFIDIELSENEIKKISDNNIKYKVLINDMSKFYRERYDKSALKNKSSLKGINYETPVNFNFGSMGGFLTLDEVMTELDDMTTQYPNLISAKYTIGKQLNGPIKNKKILMIGKREKTR